MRFRNIELWLAFAAIAAITVLYLGVVLLSNIPAASGFFGHSLGIVGFILMLMTEILYSLRKRYLLARWGKMQHWLSFHIFTGLVGPYMVLLHTSWKFNGLAGILMLMTVIIVISGFIGRYFYTAVPRDADGTILEVEQLNLLIAKNKPFARLCGATFLARIPSGTGPAGGRDYLQPDRQAVEPVRSQPAVAQSGEGNPGQTPGTTARDQAVLGTPGDA